jgi:hypothetical protein
MTTALTERIVARYIREAEQVRPSILASLSGATRGGLEGARREIGAMR